MHRFCRELIRFRLAHPAFLRSEFYTGGDPDDELVPDVAWFDADGSPHDWSAASRRLALLIDGSSGAAPDGRDDHDFYLMLNADRDDAVFAVAPVPPGRVGLVPGRGHRAAVARRRRGARARTAARGTGIPGARPVAGAARSVLKED